MRGSRRAIAELLQKGQIVLDIPPLHDLGIRAQDDHNADMATCLSVRRCPGTRRAHQSGTQPAESRLLSVLWYSHARDKTVMHVTKPRGWLRDVHHPSGHVREVVYYAPLLTVLTLPVLGQQAEGYRRHYGAESGTSGHLRQRVVAHLHSCPADERHSITFRLLASGPGGEP